MAELPEHLLERSRLARERLTGAAGEAPAQAAEITPVAAAATVVAATAAPVAVIEAPPEPTKPWVQNSLNRKKIPWWIAPVLLFLPVWMGIYFGTLERPAVQAEGVLSTGGQIYESSCAGCHGATGGGGSGPQLNDGEVLATFTSWEDQVAWVVNGSPAAGIPYGDADRPGGQRESAGAGKMPAFNSSLEADQILAVVMYERVQHGGQDEHDLAVLEAVATGIEHGELTVEFEDGMTGDDIRSLVADLGFDTAELAAE